MSLDDLAFIEGLNKWTPLREVLVRVDTASALSTRAKLPVAPMVETPSYSYAATMQPPEHLVYAGFWLRFVALVIDVFIIIAVRISLGFLLSSFIVLFAYLTGTDVDKMTSSSNVNITMFMLLCIMEFVRFAVILVIDWLYFAKFESGPMQATLGKRILGLKVTDEEGRRIGFGRASGRFFGKIVSLLTLYIGFIMAAFTDRKQALHDMIAGTLVVKR